MEAVLFHFITGDTLAIYSLLALAQSRQLRARVMRCAHGPESPSRQPAQTARHSQSNSSKGAGSNGAGAAIS
ncbi:hypothetical protein DBV39_04850 [Orrella marina]|uniref:Uncharacterized protein n=1 Tax=Orrella marina TaxID=2163011 RepID=A0A2R4XHE7_9BURK|nr:hypothetical protein DBV39_04850 [Orrella marina]